MWSTPSAPRADPPSELVRCVHPKLAPTTGRVTWRVRAAVAASDRGIRAALQFFRLYCPGYTLSKSDSRRFAACFAAVAVIRELKSNACYWPEAPGQLNWKRALNT